MIRILINMASAFRFSSVNAAGEISYPTMAPIALFRRLYQIATARSAEVLKDEGLVPLEFGVLIRVSESPGMDQVTLASVLALDRTTTSAVVAQLEKRGLIEREVSPDDRRARVLRLTKKGAAMHERIRPRSEAAQKAILAGLSQTEQKSLVSMLVRIIGDNESYMRAGAGRRNASPQPSLRQP